MIKHFFIKIQPNICVCKKRNDKESDLLNAETKQKKKKKKKKKEKKK